MDRHLARIAGVGMTAFATPKPAAAPVDSGLTDDLYDLPKQVHDVSETVYHWFRTDSFKSFVVDSLIQLDD